MAMTEEERYDYAALLVLEHARDVEYLTVHELAEEHIPGGEIDDEDAKKVHDLIGEAVVTVTWKDHPHLWDNQIPLFNETETDE